MTVNVAVITCGRHEITAPRSAMREVSKGTHLDELADSFTDADITAHVWPRR